MHTLDINAANMRFPPFSITLKQSVAPGRFCVLPGAELSRRYGHANVYAEDFETFLAMVRKYSPS